MSCTLYHALSILATGVRQACSTSLYSPLPQRTISLYCTVLYSTYRRHSKIQCPYKEMQAGFTVDQPEDYNAVFLKTRSSKESTLLMIVRLSSLPPSQPVRNTVFCVKSKPQNSPYIPTQLPVLSDHSLQGISASERICAGQR